MPPVREGNRALGDRRSRRSGTALVGPPARLDFPLVPMPQTRPRTRRRLSILREFLDSGALSGLLLAGAVILAMMAANSPLSKAYFAALRVHVLGMEALYWINDGLMALFFLFVGLEIKREFLTGRLSSWSHRLLPLVAAGGGVAAPALIYVAINAASPATIKGWAIPAATDIAFALGVLTLFGSRAPASLKVFLATLAIVDDLAAVFIIAVFYTAKVNVLALAGAGLVVALLMAMNRFGVRRLAPYLVLGAALWCLVLVSGVHATVAGVLLAMTIPMRSGAGFRDGAHAPAERLEHALAPLASYAIAPVFAFANAGVSLEGLTVSDALRPVALGVAAGLFLGKQVGVFTAAWLAIRSGLARLPTGASWAQLYGVSLLTGVGFTMSLFIGLLAFEDPSTQVAVKIGVFSGSLASALVGAGVLHFSRRRHVKGTGAKPAAEKVTLT